MGSQWRKVSPVCSSSRESQFWGRIDKFLHLKLYYVQWSKLGLHPRLPVSFCASLMPVVSNSNRFLCVVMSPLISLAFIRFQVCLK